MCLSRRAGPPPSGHHQSAAPRRSLRPPSCQLQPGGPAGHRVATARGLKAGLVGADCCLIVLFRAAVPRLGRRRLSGGGRGREVVSGWERGGGGAASGRGTGGIQPGRVSLISKRQRSDGVMHLQSGRRPPGVAAEGFSEILLLSRGRLFFFFFFALK